MTVNSGIRSVLNHDHNNGSILGKVMANELTTNPCPIVIPQSNSCTMEEVSGLYTKPSVGCIIIIFYYYLKKKEINKFKTLPYKVRELLTSKHFAILNKIKMLVHTKQV